MADAGVRRHGLEVREGALTPAEEGVALAVAAELEGGVPLDREPRREVVDLHGVVDHELDRDQRVDLLRVAAEIGHRRSHRGEIDDRRDAGEVLQEDARGVVADLVRRLGGGIPAGDRLDVTRGDGDAVLAPQDVLEQDAQGVREPRDVVAGLQCVAAEDLELATADRERRARAEGVGVGHGVIVEVAVSFACTDPSRRASKLVDSPLGQARLRAVEVARDRRAVRARDTSGVAPEALVAKRCEILVVRIEDVLTADVPRGVEEGDADTGRDVEQGSPLADGLGPETVEERRHLGRGGKATRIGAQIGERPAEGGELERRDVDQSRRRARTSRERREQTRRPSGGAPPRASTPATLSSRTNASRYVRVPFVTSAPAASSQSGEKPKAAIEPISTTLPGALADHQLRRIRLVFVDRRRPEPRRRRRPRSRPAAGSSPSPRTAASGARAAAGRAPPSRAHRLRRARMTDRTARSGNERRKAMRPAIVSIIADG